MDRNSIAQRLQQLKDERSAGDAQLQQLDARKRELQQTLLRIDGAIQVLEEFLRDQEEPPASA
jgi:prefoldin subunit 5